MGRDTATVLASQPPAPPQFTVDPSTYPIASPWSSGDLQRIVFEDIFGSEIPVNTRSAAMRIATVARARSLICSTVSRMPMLQLRAGEQRPDPIADPEAWLEVSRRAPWLYTTGNGSPARHRMVWTVDDLIFYGWSCWWRGKNAASTRFPLEAGRLNMGDWSVNADNRVEVYGQVASDEQVILIPGYHEGILSYGVDVLRDAKNLYASVSNRIASPIPAIDLHQTEGETLSPEERAELIATWIAARRSPEGAVGYTNKSIEARVLETSSDDGKLMIEARNAAAVDIARMMGVSAGMVDATAPKASLNYETQTGRNQEFLDNDVELYMGPLEARFSEDDVTPAGSRVAFDRTAVTSPTLPVTGPDSQE